VRWRAVAVSFLVIVSALAADPPGTPASREALARCNRTDELHGPERTKELEDSLARADAAIASDDTDALAHFAAFCALGRLLKDAGMSVAAPWRLRRLRREVDRTLELAPDFADALAGKGALLASLPRLLGGDVGEAEGLLRRAIAIDPNYLTPRFALVDVLRGRGAIADARREAAGALEVAERKQSADDVRRARAELDALGGAVPNP
jgi:tetratricopeptide (TPR) repeat protein